MDIQDETLERTFIPFPVFEHIDKCCDFDTRYNVRSVLSWKSLGMHISADHWTSLWLETNKVTEVRQRGNIDGTVR